MACIGLNKSLVVNIIRSYAIIINEIQQAENHGFIPIQFACNPIQSSLNENEYFPFYCSQSDALTQIQLTPPEFTGILTGAEG